MATHRQGQKLTRVRSQLKTLINQYKKARTDLHAKQEAARQAAVRSLALKLKIDSLVAQYGLDVYRAVFTVRQDRKSGRSILELIAAGKNLDVSAARGRGEVVDFTGQGCEGVCNEAMDIAQGQLAQDGLDPTMTISCTCTCHEGNGVVSGIAECIQVVEA